jgi:hypothetical protein
VLFQHELDALAKVDKHERPAGWRLSPRAVLTYVLSQVLIQGTAGTTEEHIRYTWNYAMLLAEGPTPRALVPSPVYRGMAEGKIMRFEEITRCPSEVQDALITMLSEKVLSVPELGSQVKAQRGFNIIATANTRDRGVNDMSAALKRRFNMVVLPVPTDLATEIEIVEKRVREIGANLVSEVAGAMRRAGTVRSAAEVIEAVRLANTLAALHGEASQPTLRDLRDAATTCLGHGEASVVARHCEDIEIGAAIGKVPDGVPRTSIQEDFYHWIKALKLEDYLEDKEQDVKGATSKPWLDLREDRFAKSPDAAFRDRNRSIFFHRLTFLGIEFAKPCRLEGGSQGTFKEAWKARWTPECEIALVENALRGETIEAAVARRFEEEIAAVHEVDAAARLARRAVECDVHPALAAATARVQALAVDEAGFVAIAQACEELAKLTRYKEPLVAQLFLRGTLLAHAACRCDDNAARGVVSPAQGHRHHDDEQGDDPKAVATALKRQQEVAAFEDWAGTLLATERWFATLDAIADDDGANPYLAGMACALLLERGLLADDVLDRRVARRLSPGTEPAKGASFFEGLASRNRMALLSRRSLWVAMTTFIEGLDDEAFRRALVGLRRAFGTWEQGEIRRIGDILADVWGAGGREIAAALEVRVDEKELESLASDLGDLDL